MTTKTSKSDVLWNVLLQWSELWPALYEGNVLSKPTVTLIWSNSRGIIITRIAWNDTAVHIIAELLCNHVCSVVQMIIRDFRRPVIVLTCVREGWGQDVAAVCWERRGGCRGRRGRMWRECSQNTKLSSHPSLTADLLHTLTHTPAAARKASKLPSLCKLRHENWCRANSSVKRVYSFAAACTVSSLHLVFRCHIFIPCILTQPTYTDTQNKTKALPGKVRLRFILYI